MLKYENTEKGIFISRSNRFTAIVMIDGNEETVHVKNTGRLGELLLPGAEVAVQRADDENRRTKYDLISVYKESLGWVNIDSLAPNKLVREWLQSNGYDRVKPEYRYRNSRIDFYMEKDGEKWLVEVKGCTLEKQKTGYFPDAVSSRAVKHENDLSYAAAEGYHAATAFVIAMNGVEKVEANEEKDPAFAAAYEKAGKCGVETWFFPCRVEADSIEIIGRNIKNNCK